MVYPKLTHVVAGQTAIKDVPPTIFHPEHSLVPTFRADAEQILKGHRDTLPTNAGFFSTATSSLTPPSKS